MRISWLRTLAIVLLILAIGVSCSWYVNGPLANVGPYYDVTCYKSGQIIYAGSHVQSISGGVSNKIVIGPVWEANTIIYGADACIIVRSLDASRP